jgi:hypothetical protein
MSLSGQESKKPANRRVTQWKAAKAAAGLAQNRQGDFD